MDLYMVGIAFLREDPQRLTQSMPRDEQEPGIKVWNMPIEP